MLKRFHIRLFMDFSEWNDLSFVTITIPRFSDVRLVEDSRDLSSTNPKTCRYKLHIKWDTYNFSLGLESKAKVENENNKTMQKSFVNGYSKSSNIQDSDYDEVYTKQYFINAKRINR